MNSLAYEWTLENMHFAINCPKLHLALKPEPPGGAPWGYRQALALSVYELLPVLGFSIVGKEMSSVVFD